MYKNINDLLFSGKTILKHFGIDQSQLDSEIFLSITLKQTREYLPLITLEVTDYKTSKQFLSYIERRTFKEPVAYINNEQEFYSLSFYVNQNVLIPRCETELLTESILKKNPKFANILEIGVGSGNIVNTLNCNLLNNYYHGMDISLAALKVAVKNNKKISRVTATYFKSDLLENPPIIAQDIVISNPPYIKTNDISFLMDDVKCFEPKLALDGSQDGLLFYRMIALYGKKILTQNGQVLLEIGENMSQDVINIFKQKNYILDDVLVDLANIPRVLIFRITR